MLKYFLKTAVIILLLVFTACKQNGVAVVSSEAKDVNRDKSLITGEFNRIKEGSILNWNASHLAGLDPRNGKIYYEKASISVSDNVVKNASVSIDMNTMTVDNIPEDGAKELVSHLKTEDFFDISKFPSSKFEMTSSEEIKGKYNSMVTGNLTLLGISKSITFKANVVVSDDNVSIDSEAFGINRADWGMTYNAKGTAGIPLDYLISDQVGFQIKLVVGK